MIAADNLALSHYERANTTSVVGITDPVCMTPFETCVEHDHLLLFLCNVSSYLYRIQCARAASDCWVKEFDNGISGCDLRSSNQPRCTSLIPRHKFSKPDFC